MQKVQLALTMFSADRGLTKEKVSELIGMLPEGEIFPIVISGETGYAAGFASNEWYTLYDMCSEKVNAEIREKLNDWELMKTDAVGENIFRLHSECLPKEARITYYMDFENEQNG